MLALLVWLLVRDAQSGPDKAEIAAILNVQLGGDTTIVTTNRNSFGLPAANLTNLERRTFEVGDSFFTQNWVTAPGIDRGAGWFGADVQRPVLFLLPYAGRAGPAADRR